jgi:hypothetical protein
MSYDDWLKTFDLCQIVNLTPDSIIKDLSNVVILLIFNAYKVFFLL